MPYLFTFDRTMPYLNTLDRFIPYVNTLRKKPKTMSAANQNHSAETLSHILIQWRNTPRLNTWSQDPSRHSAAIAFFIT